MSTTMWQQTRPIAVVGAAFGDILLTVGQLPQSGEDIVGQETDRQIGGCAFNVARALARLDIAFLNGILVGNGSWGQQVARTMAQEGFAAKLYAPHQDNGWCVAIVEPSKQRSFITIEGCEQHWDIAELNKLGQLHDHLVYLSGYEMVNSSSAPLQHWLLSLADSNTLFIDFGPRIAAIDHKLLAALLLKKPILTLNRDEAPVLVGKDNPSIDQIAQYCHQHQTTIIYRLDKQGAWAITPNQPPAYIPALPVKVVDTVGAGDSHCAGVLAGLSCQSSIEQAVQLGNAVAAYVVSTQGAGNPPTRAAIQQMLMRH